MDLASCRYGILCQWINCQRMDWQWCSLTVSSILLKLSFKDQIVAPSLNALHCDLPLRCHRIGKRLTNRCITFQKAQLKFHQCLALTSKSNQAIRWRNKIAINTRTTPPIVPVRQRIAATVHPYSRWQIHTDRASTRAFSTACFAQWNPSTCRHAVSTRPRSSGQDYRTIVEREPMETMTITSMTLIFLDIKKKQKNKTEFRWIVITGRVPSPEICTVNWFTRLKLITSPW